MAYARVLQLFAAAGLTALAGRSVASQSVRLERVYALDHDEGVFAYARISPDGSRLAYASERPVKDGPPQTETLVNLQTHEILWREPGMDAYWAPAGDRFVFMAFRGRSLSVSIRETAGHTTRDVVTPSAGDYFSWGVRDGHDLILTITNNYFFLRGDSAELPIRSIPPCPGYGTGQRPLLSKDGKRVTTFVRGTIVVRNLTDCDDIIDTGMEGAKADFSWDGRYIAFHAPKTSGAGYDILVVDLQDRTVRTITHLPGSSLFPSWTRDGRLCFRYDGPDYRGFLIASGVLTEPARPLTSPTFQREAAISWNDVIPEMPAPSERNVVVLAWGPWSAHTPQILAAIRTVAESQRRSTNTLFVIATDPSSDTSDVARAVRPYASSTRVLRIAPERLPLTQLSNQNPAWMWFHDGRLIDRRLGPLSVGELETWLAPMARP